jgi:thioredoxin-like negative regulator of GroEL
MRSALLVSLVVSGCATAPRALPFVEDDFPAALAQARRAHLPLFVDAWAPWCHSCLALREHVLNQPALAAQQGRYVWLSLNTELPGSADFLAAYPMDTWPTLFILEPASGQVALKWVGTATTPQVLRLLDEGEAAVAHRTGEGPEGLRARAGQQLAAGHPAQAAALLSQALESAPPDWPQAPLAVEALATALFSARDYPACAATAVARGPSLPKGPAAFNTVVWGLTCATAAGEREPWRAAALTALEPLGKAALDTPGVLGDDTSGLYELLVEVREQASDAAGAAALALQWLAFLEGQAAAARSPSQRASFDAHRVAAALAAHQPQRARAALEQSARDFPQDYNAPARLALLAREEGQLEQAKAHAQRALGLAYGPRKLRVYDTLLSILRKQGDASGARATLTEALAYGRALPEAQRPKQTLERLEGELGKQP